MKGLHQIYTELYHGSMSDFKEFTLDHVGEAFGSAYGYGIYLSELQKIAKSYTKNSKGTVICKLDGIKTSDRVAKLVGGIHYSLSKNPVKILEILKQLASDRVAKGELTEDDLETINKASALKYFKGGFVYNVELIDRNEPYDFLEWDHKKPSQEQIDKIKAQLNSLGYDDRLNYRSGMDLYLSIQGDTRIWGDKNASKFLLKCGIDGIKYNEGGYYNYVIFDPKVLKIVRRVAY